MFALSIENKQEFLKVKQTDLNACRKGNEETSRGCQHLIKDKDKAFKRGSMTLYKAQLSYNHCNKNNV